MQGLNSISFILDRYGVVILVVVSTFLALEVVFRAWRDRRRNVSYINARLRVKDDIEDGRVAYVELLRRRGLDSGGGYRLPLIALNRLIVQSGVDLRLGRAMLFISALGLAAWVGAFAYTREAFFATFWAVVASIVLPLIVLYMLRSKRMKKFEAQLPDAIDTMVRSLKAGHPVAVAVGLVGKEMSDPIGTEFGLVADEMTYGLDLEGAMNNLRMRTGQQDLSFLVVALSVQAKTGGNLAEILVGLSQVIRARAKMRRKVHSLSSEGRFSAIALSTIPCVMYGAISFSAPKYYSSVSNDPAFMLAVYLGLALWVTGMIVMYRMVNFKI